MGRLRAADIGRRFHLRKKKRQQPEKPTAGVIVADRVGFEPTSRLRDYLISSQGRYDHFDTYPYMHFTNARMIITNPAEKIKSGGTISVNSVPPAVEFPQILLYSIFVRADLRRKYA